MFTKWYFMLLILKTTKTTKKKRKRKNEKLLKKESRARWKTISKNIEYFLFSLCHFNRFHWYISLQHLHDLYILYIFFRYHPISFSAAAASSFSFAIVVCLSCFVRTFFSFSTFECFKNPIVRKSVAMKNHSSSLCDVLTSLCLREREWEVPAYKIYICDLGAFWMGLCAMNTKSYTIS